MQKTIILNGVRIDYELTRKRVRNLNLRVAGDGTVKVSCPYHAGNAEVEQFLRSNSDFIFRAVEKVNARIDNAARPKEYSDGEQVNVFGERCTMHVSRDYTFRGVRYEYPDVYVRAQSPEQACRAYETWRRRALRDKIAEMLGYYYPMFAVKGVDPPSKVTFRTMSSRWGVCQPSTGKLTFNYNLFETPEELIAYVVVHELAHFLEANHSERFWAHVADVMPDYKIRRKALGDY
ncbi:MAG: M48 family metallopeptidase [Clostridiales bacterium]|nr:M48 family metallopeptidase [Clostridiales bacterium]